MDGWIDGWREEDEAESKRERGIGRGIGRGRGRTARANSLPDLAFPKKRKNIIKNMYTKEMRIS